jgi:hypothetical protein
MTLQPHDFKQRAINKNTSSRCAHPSTRLHGPTVEVHTSDAEEDDDKEIDEKHQKL